jgi:biotin carboxylase
MNLLVTNTRNAQAYAIIRALRPHADKIVATMEGDNRLAARLSHAANSRLVDKRYYTPSPAKDWRAGRIQKENTESEEAYMQAVLRVCEQENIDTIFPSFDPHVYVLSKNKERLARMGVLIPIPDYGALITPLDKYRTARAAEEAGFPCPKTCLPERKDDLRRAAGELGFPLLIKPRFTAGGRGTEIVTEFSGLWEKIQRIKLSQGMPILQEYIPGRERRTWHLILDKQYELKAAFFARRWRNFARVIQSLSIIAESASAHAKIAPAVTLARKLGLWGDIAVQTKIDPRDDTPKLIEINPRPGYRLWERTELGFNEPLLCLQVARGETIGTVKDYPVGKWLLDPVEDLMWLGFGLLDLILYRYSTEIQGRVSIDPYDTPMSVKQLIGSYKEIYLNGKENTFSPYFRYFFQDPFVSILWWCQFSTLLVKAGKHLGL